MRVMMSYALRILRTSRRRQLYVGAHSAHLKWAEIKKVQFLFRNDLIAMCHYVGLTSTSQLKSSYSKINVFDVVRNY